MELKWQITPRTCNMCVVTCVCRPSGVLINHSASSTVSPDEKVVVVANLYDGLDWYKIPDRTFSRSVPLRINHNVPIPVSLVDEGKTLLVGGTAGTVKVLDAHTAETVQTLDHDRKTSTVKRPSTATLIKPNPLAEVFIQALVCAYCPTFYSSFSL